MSNAGRFHSRVDRGRRRQEDDRADAIRVACAKLCYAVRGSGISRSRQIFRTKKSLISRCLGTDEAFRLARFTYTVWLPPSRKNSQPCSSK